MRRSRLEVETVANALVCWNERFLKVGPSGESRCNINVVFPLLKVPIKHKLTAHFLQRGLYSSVNTILIPRKATIHFISWPSPSSPSPKPSEYITQRFQFLHLARIIWYVRQSGKWRSQILFPGRLQQLASWWPGDVIMTQRTNWGWIAGRDSGSF